MMLKSRIRNLLQRFRGLPCPECNALRRVEWREVNAAGLEPAETGPPPLCARCRQPLAIRFVEVVRPEVPGA